MNSMCESSSHQLAKRSIGDVSRLVFPQFVQLPAEARLHIWHLALPGRRYIDIMNTISLDDFAEIGFYKNTWHPVASELAPVLYFVCQESRAEVMRLYKPLRSNDYFPTIWYNPKVDVLCLEYEFCEPEPRQEMYLLEKFMSILHILGMLISNFSGSSEVTAKLLPRHKSLLRQEKSYYESHGEREWDGIPNGKPISMFYGHLYSVLLESFILRF
ncbi:hypothetical protein BJ875DRAFT_441217 [Amylocarpus encephaloides]|uniref:2EXR domain-containing protein n=1 Tax=Amylocarpus encephaloides TaxID=45428 RepID=A0A9P7YIU4_9HELO|nr:hypothetical protein BJ875DRAFT_441217 [Amylocarpus encephaloides]